MRIQRWWLPTAVVLLVGIGLAAYPTLQFSSQTLSGEKNKSYSDNQPNPTSKHSPTTDITTQTAEALYQGVSPAVVTVYGADGMGSGMILRPDGLLLTNKHLIDNVAAVKVKTATGATYDGTVVDFDLRYDLALIRLKGQNLNLPIVMLANSTAVQAGDRIYAIGSPGGKAGTMTTGTFTRITEHGSLQTSTGLLSPGNSGGPLLNAQGQVIGVNKGLLSNKTGLATPISAAKNLINRYDQINNQKASAPWMEQEARTY
ncbi:MAG: trypsin-like peptidase domain-containing protein [Oscillatoriales cyanobacterium C42_A2020_001]|nr:trypsin-like peptidase domain-containing protein [Leptolyngbyaceae cyanobacterium C42_A2020_001]